MPPNSKKELWIEPLHKYFCINTGRDVSVCAKDVDLLEKEIAQDSFLSECMDAIVRWDHSRSILLLEDIP